MSDEHKFISDEEWERRFDEEREAERQKYWAEHEDEIKAAFEAMCERHRTEPLVGMVYHKEEPKPVRVRVLDETNDKWEHGEIFFPHPEWWKNPEYTEADDDQT